MSRPKPGLIRGLSVKMAGPCSVLVDMVEEQETGSEKNAGRKGLLVRTDESDLPSRRGEREKYTLVAGGRA